MEATTDCIGQFAKLQQVGLGQQSQRIATVKYATIFQRMKY
jgi:hypothetical protein